MPPSTVVLLSLAELRPSKPVDYLCPYIANGVITKVLFHFRIGPFLGSSAQRSHTHTHTSLHHLFHSPSSAGAVLLSCCPPSSAVRRLLSSFYSYCTSPLSLLNSPNTLPTLLLLLPHRIPYLPFFSFCLIKFLFISSPHPLLSGSVAGRKRVLSIPAPTTHFISQVAVFFNTYCLQSKSRCFEILGEALSSTQLICSTIISSTMSVDVSTLKIKSIDLHAEGEPARVIVAGLSSLVLGTTMYEKRLYFKEHLDHIRKLLITEPRGYPCQVIISLASDHLTFLKYLFATVSDSSYICPTHPSRCLSER